MQINRRMPESSDFGFDVCLQKSTKQCSDRPRLFSLLILSTSSTDNLWLMTRKMSQIELCDVISSPWHLFLETKSKSCETRVSWVPIFEQICSPFTNWCSSLLSATNIYNKISMLLDTQSRPTK